MSAAGPLSPRAMILAAGRGARMRPLSDTTPKPLLRVANTSLLERHLRGLAAAGFGDVVINLGWLGEQIPAAIGDGSRYGLRVQYSAEGWPALETGGGVFRALPLLGAAPFVVISADIWSDYAYARLRERALQLAPQELAHLVLVPNPEFHPDGDFGLIDGRVVNAPRRWTFGNLSVLRPQLFEGCADGAFPISGLWRAAADAGRVTGECYSGFWRNLGTPEQLHAMDDEIRERGS